MCDNLRNIEIEEFEDFFEQLKDKITNFYLTKNEKIIILNKIESLKKNICKIVIQEKYKDYYLVNSEFVGLFAICFTSIFRDIIQNKNKNKENFNNLLRINKLNKNVSNHIERRNI
jgi:hypothetical protein